MASPHWQGGSVLYGGGDDEASGTVAALVQEVHKLIRWYDQGVVTSEEALALLQQAFRVQDNPPDGFKTDRNELTLQP